MPSSVRKATRLLVGAKSTANGVIRIVGDGELAWTEGWDAASKSWTPSDVPMSDVVGAPPVRGKEIVALGIPKPELPSRFASKA